MTSWSFGVLGPLLVSHGDAEIRIGSRQQRRLLLILLAHVNEAVSTERLVDALWPDATPAQGKNRLRVLVRGLRATLEADDPILLTRAPGYVVVAERSAVDAERFEDLVKRAQPLLETRPDLSADYLREALALWRGEPLVDAEYLDFLQARIQHLNELAQSAREGLARADIALGDYEAAAASLSQLVGGDPYRETAQAQLVLALYLAGEQRRAMVAYDDALSVLAEVGLDPSPELRAVGSRVAAQDPGLVPARPTVRGNIPAALGPLAGRTDDLGRLHEAIEHGRGRITTLVGPGGVGKTRLAVEAAAELAKGFTDGGWFVDLTQATTDDGVAETVISTLGLAPDSSATRMDELRAFVEAKQLLIVLDNCEHVLGGAARTAEELAGWGAAVIATSRGALGSRGESVLPVEGLEVGEVDHPGPAVGLYRELLASARGRAVPSEELADALALCSRVAGLPLAIEILAARARRRPTAELLNDFDRAILVTSHSGPLVPERHQSLDATIRWSYDLLSTEARGLMEGWAVMTGAATLDAAADISGSSPWAVAVRGVEELVDSSLLRLDPTTSRYRMLEPIRVFAANEIDPDRLRALRDRHARYYSGLAATGSRRLGDHDDWEDTLRLEQPNLEAALHHAASSEEDDMIRWLVWALSSAWLASGRTSDIDSWTARLSRFSPSDMPTMWVDVHERRVLALLLEGNRREAARVLEQMRDEASDQELPELELSIAFLEGWFASNTGDHAASRSAYLRAIPLAEELNDRRLAAFWANLGTMAAWGGDIDEAHRCAAALRRMSLTSETTYERDLADDVDGLIAYQVGDAELALELFERLAQQFGTTGHQNMAATTARWAALAAAACDDVPKARALLKLSIDVDEGVLPTQDVDAAYAVLGLVDVLDSQPKQAIAAVAKSFRSQRTHPVPIHLIPALVALEATASRLEAGETVSVLGRALDDLCAITGLEIAAPLRQMHAAAMEASGGPRSDPVAGSIGGLDAIVEVGDEAMAELLGK